METAACSKFHFVKELSMTPVRQRMTEDMQVRNLSPHTQASYIQQVSLFARYFGKSPEVLGSEEIRAYQVYLTNEKKLASSSILIAVSALRFLYKVTLHRDWALEDIIPAPKKPHKLPVVLSPEEVLHFLDCVAGPKHRTILTTCYAAGLRISEAIRLRAIDIDSQRMMIRVEQGKGQKDRYVMLSPKLLETLRNWWRAAKPKPWLFPGDIPGGHIHREAVELACQKARRCCGIAKPITPHSGKALLQRRVHFIDGEAGNVVDAGVTGLDNSFQPGAARHYFHIGQRHHGSAGSGDGSIQVCAVYLSERQASNEGGNQSKAKMPRHESLG
jgi:integrase/recombinase XerD